MQAIDDGLELLSQLQLADGSFNSLSSPTINDFQDSVTYSTTFTTSLILINLQHLKNHPKAQPIISKGCKFLLTQASASWSFNYWNRNSLEYITKPYPDDLDDTFLALTALTLHQPKLFTGKIMAKIAQLLTATENSAGGPYKTWLSDDPKWSDIDPTVNAIIGYFLYLHDTNLPNLHNYLQKQLENNSYKSLYYPNNKAFLYLSSQFIKFSTKIITSDQQNPLETALDCITLLNTDSNNKNIDRLINFILQEQFQGGWPVQGYCFDPSINNQNHYNGAASLTTAFCLEALALYNDKYSAKKADLIHFDQEDLLQHKIITTAKNIVSNFDSNFQQRFNFWLNKINNFDKTRQITLLPFKFYQSLIKTKPIDNDLLFKLGLANLVGWMAYTIYDSFLDSDSNPTDLPVANIAFKQLINIYQSIANPINQVIAQMEQASLWEVTNCRNLDVLPNWNNYRQLANRSFGHVLSPLTLLISQGYSTQSEEYILVTDFFNHYLIAKQLLDDLHDWQEDLSKKHLTPVVSLLIKSQSSDLNQTFWQQTLDQICKIIFKHCLEAKQLLKKTTIFENTDYLKQLITSLEKSAKLALSERDQALQFLQTFNNISD